MAVLRYWINLMRIIETDWSTHKKQLMLIRSQVFIEEQNVPEELEIDEFDPEAIHFLVEYKTPSVQDAYIATARLLKDGHIGRIAVIKACRNRGVGSKLLQHILLKSKKLGHLEVFLHAQIDAKSFYEKHGFYVQGEIFMEAGIPHVNMIKQLDHE